jgi:formylglycine-generating enzyme required for sulfatase activity
VIPDGIQHTNSIGMEFVRIESGTFSMGHDKALPDELVRLSSRACGDFDERPVHDVAISDAFYLGATPVTNAQYELFDPSHRSLRGKLGFSCEDDEAVVFVSWHDATAYCEWLSEKEGVIHRLPTEAEWEYACRAGTDSPYSSGDSLPQECHLNQNISWWPDEEHGDAGRDIVPLHVGRTPENPFGLRDMHGLVEEWCRDWYGPYEGSPQTDPVGPVLGDFRVSRGGSHSTESYFLRSANRMGTLPDDRNWLIGFRVAIGDIPQTATSAPPPVPLHRRNVTQVVVRRRSEGNSEQPYFHGPRIYMRIRPDSDGPIYSEHNHVPSIVECPNGDLLSAWYTCYEEPGREVATVGARLRRNVETGNFVDKWDRPTMFWDAPDRNDHTSALWNDGRGSIWHFCGLSTAATWGNLALVLRTSSDNGATWSPARLIIPEHGIRHMPVTTVFRAQDGSIVLPCDAVTGGAGGTALWISSDDGATWNDAGGTIAGIHAAVTQLDDGRLMAFGRGNEVDGMMPMSISEDMGATWEVGPSVFPPVHGGQRPVLLKLKSGELFFAAFSNDPSDIDDPHCLKDWMHITDRTGTTRPVLGLYCAISQDDGATWSNTRLVSDDGPEHVFESMDGGMLPMTRSASEHAGYLCATQTEDSLIHLATSRNHYIFNRAWLKELPPGL